MSGMSRKTTHQKIIRLIYRNCNATVCVSAETRANDLLNSFFLCKNAEDVHLYRLFATFAKDGDILSFSFADKEEIKEFVALVLSESAAMSYEVLPVDSKACGSMLNQQKSQILDSLKANLKSLSSLDSLSGSTVNDYASKEFMRSRLQADIATLEKWMRKVDKALASVYLTKSEIKEQASAEKLIDIDEQEDSEVEIFEFTENKVENSKIPDEKPVWFDSYMEKYRDGIIKQVTDSTNERPPKWFLDYLEKERAEKQINQAPKWFEERLDSELNKMRENILDSVKERVDELVDERLKNHTKGMIAVEQKITQATQELERFVLSSVSQNENKSSSSVATSMVTNENDDTDTVSEVSGVEVINECDYPNENFIMINSSSTSASYDVVERLDAAVKDDIDAFSDHTIDGEDMVGSDEEVLSKKSACVETVETDVEMNELKNWLDDDAEVLIEEVTNEPRVGEEKVETIPMKVGVEENTAIPNAPEDRESNRYSYVPEKSSRRLFDPYERFQSANTAQSSSSGAYSYAHASSAAHGSDALRKLGRNAVSGVSSVFNEGASLLKDYVNPRVPSSNYARGKFISPNEMRATLLSMGLSPRILNTSEPMLHETFIILLNRALDGQLKRGSGGYFYV